MSKGDKIVVGANAAATALNLGLGFAGAPVNLGLGIMGVLFTALLWSALRRRA